jgi:hypothetical protein
MAETYSLADVRAMASADSGTFSLAEVQAMAANSQPTFAQQMLKRETSDLSSNLRRGVRDVIDTGAEGLAWAYDKLTGTDPAQGEYARVKQMNEAGKAEWTKANEGLILPHIQRIGGNALATVPATSALGAGVGAVGLPRLGNAISSAGMSTGGGLSRTADLLTRTAGGAANGYVTAGLVEPSTAGTGAVIGSVTPGVLQGMGAAGKAAQQAYSTRGEVGLARDIASMAGAESLDDIARVRDALRQQGPALIPGAEPTVPQILQTPAVSQLQRSVKAASPAALTARETEQHAARLDALNRIAPVSGTVQQAAEDAGNAIAGYAIPARNAEKARVSRLFEGVDPSGETRINLPIEEMKAARAQFMGRGTFGAGGSAEQAIQTAEEIGKPATFQEIQNLRSSIGEAFRAANRNGNAKEAAALGKMLKEIDGRVAAVSDGTGTPAEYFPAEASAKWKEALTAHKARKLRFDTGPQASIFRQGGDGLPQIQGAEIPSKFFGASRSQVENAQAFRRLVANDPQLLSDLRRYAITDAAGQVDRFGNLTNSKFNRWLDARSGATGEIFNEHQRAILKAVADDLRRADMAESLGRSTGSDTAQKAANMMRLGLMDSPGMNYAASRIPGGRSVLDFFRGPAQAAKAERIGGLLAEPERVGGLLETFIATQQPKQLGLLGQALTPALYRGGPLLLGGGN